MLSRFDLINYAFKEINLNSRKARKTNFVDEGRISHIGMFQYEKRGWKYLSFEMKSKEGWRIEKRSTKQKDIKLACWTFALFGNENSN